MLILTRKLGECVIIGDNIKLTVVEINKNQIKFGIEAPKSVAIHREEVFKKIKDENEHSSSSNLIDLS
ncbi:MAG: carbon storage regulator [Candidatus Scalindua sp. AMX11]|nr:MAG: carbon storage regulator [Candidatus Scalindua sp.]NOG85819.1 carbon storage regulator CsrA [Planctomycetota bacterium]RZV97007.1 MAG: carbon storage regulator [Candidatus Scalindua sp. SCAELEC01]TDE66381.1 MAG: carbon storage regulator [Candidatus Scalindua sp. AMX11]GJQ58228.1 MAG: carbon storage regulator [Candidatus Scalindua sp.]